MRSGNSYIVPGTSHTAMVGRSHYITVWPERRRELGRIDSAIKNYLKYAERTGCGIMWASDGEEIMKHSISQNGHGYDIYNIIYNSLEAGFWIGYQRAKREARKARQK